MGVNRERESLTAGGCLCEAIVFKNVCAHQALATANVNDALTELKVPVLDVHLPGRSQGRERFADR